MKSRVAGARLAVERMEPYAPPDSALAAQPISIKLDANENPYGPSPRVWEVLSRFGDFNRYPDPDQKALRAAIGSYVGIDPEQIMAGNGSDELIDLLCRVYLEPDDEVIDCTPTFGMYRFSAEFCGARVVEAPRADDWSLDVAEVEAAITPRTKLLFVATPNNPTGNAAGEQAVRALLDLGPMVVLDEAYVEFSQGESWCSRVGEYPNLGVLRTFSKWAGLAGLRVGYGVFPPDVLHHLWKTKPPFNVNLAAHAAVEASLEDVPLLKQRVGWIVEERERMAVGLKAFRFLQVWPSDANFMLVQLARGGASSLKAYLADRGIAVRAYTHPRLRDALRISVGLPEHTDCLIAALLEWEERSER